MQSNVSIGKRSQARLKTLIRKKGNTQNLSEKEKREKFTVGQEVRIANKENLKTTGKSHDGFQQTGFVKKIAGNDTYLVNSDNGKIYKISHSDFKGNVDSKNSVAQGK